jgi:phage-related protein
MKLANHPFRGSACYWLHVIAKKSNPAPKPATQLAAKSPSPPAKLHQAAKQRLHSMNLRSQVQRPRKLLQIARKRYYRLNRSRLGRSTSVNILCSHWGARLLRQLSQVRYAEEGAV